MTSPTMRWPLLGFVLEEVRAAGGDAEALRRRFGLGDGADVEALLPLSRFRGLIAAAAAAAGDPLFGVHLAASLPRGRLGLYEFVSTSAATLGDGLARVARYGALVTDAVALAFAADGDEACLTLRVPGEPEALGRHTNEFFVAYTILQARRATAGAFTPSRVWLAHPRPGDDGLVAALGDALGTARLDFGREENGVALPRALVDTPLSRADPPLSRWLDDRAQALLAEVDGDAGFLARVRHVVRARLVSGAPTVAETARLVAMSPRTLQRRLAAERTTFHALVDGVRADVARHHLGDRRRSLSEIAYLCGYSELSAFLRAFKRWTGQTPSELRVAG